MRKDFNEVKMTRKESVYFKLRELSRNLEFRGTCDSLGRVGFDTQFIAEKVGINRNNTSKELNVLVKEKKIVKILGKPVMYIDKKSLESMFNVKVENYIIRDIHEVTDKLRSDANIEDKSNAVGKIGIFSQIIGYNGSLKTQVRQAKAAILYPPKGLHTLLTGSTGVGKTTFAEIMYRYAVEKGRLGANSPYIIFNCADYADNPQLLMSHLFGHTKNAFTGAENDKAGLIDKANGGILFLDEVHRLPAEGQEMLFSIMDRGTYNRLGESENMRKADVLIISATTEDPKSVMLDTFLRRIQMVIRLPGIEERTLKERMKFICSFFSEESSKIKVKVSVSKDVLKALLLYKCPGNIGQLRNDIKLICANAFLDYITEDQDYVKVEISQLSDRFKYGLFEVNDKRHELIKNFDFDGFENIFFNGHMDDRDDVKNSSIFVYEDDKIKVDLYETMLQDAQKFYENGLTNRQIKQSMNRRIKEYFNNSCFHENTEKIKLKKEVLSKIITPEIIDMVQDSFNINEYGTNKPDSKIIYSISLHIETLLERIKLKQIAIYPKIEKAYKDHKKEYIVSETIKQKLEEKFQVSIPEDEVAFMTMFIYWANKSNTKGDIQVLVIAHGYSTATNMVQVTKTLLGYDCIYALDMPLEERVNVVLEKAIELVKKINKGKGVLILVDMGSLTTFSDIITSRTGIPTRYVKMVSTPMVIEAARKAVEPNMDLDILVDSVKSISPLIAERVKVSTQPKINNLKLEYQDKTIDMLKDMLTFLDVNKISEVLNKIIMSIEKECKQQMSSILCIKFLFHCSCMVERVIRNDPLPYKNVDIIKNENKALFYIVKDKFMIVEEIFGVKIPDSEFAYIVEMLKTDFEF